MKNLLTIFVILLSTKLCAIDSKLIDSTLQSDYVFCLDGGASTSRLVVLDKDGQKQKIFKSLSSDFSYKAEDKGSSLTVSDQKDVEEVLANLLQRVYIGDDQVPSETLLSKSTLIGGFAGAGRAETIEKLQSILTGLGFSEDRIFIYSDAEVCLELADDPGGVLIDGTGSICFLKDQGEKKRYGGWGYRMADEGSGYMCGIAGIKTAFEAEYNGFDSPLLNYVKEHFQVEKANELVMPINKNQIDAAKIAKVSQFVFDEAYLGDLKAQNIVQTAASDLGKLLHRSLKDSEMLDPQIYLIGGIFQCKQNDLFVQSILDSEAFNELKSEQRPTLINISDKIPAVLIAQKILQVESE